MRFTFFIFMLSLPILSFSKETVQADLMSPEEKCAHLSQVYQNSLKTIYTSSGQITRVEFLNGFVLPCKDSKTYDLSKTKDYLDKLNHVHLSDVLLQTYPSTYSAPIYKKNYSPGRFRNDQLFINTYINIRESSEELKRLSQKKSLSPSDLDSLNRHLYKEIVSVNFLGFDISMNRRNGAAQALERVGLRLQKEAPEEARWLSETREMAGGFNIRPISGTQRLSSHSWGIAVDFTIKTAPSHLNWMDSYWKWVAVCLPPLECPAARTAGSTKVRSSAKEQNLEVQIFNDHFDHFPETVVRIFSEEGFIWGGHWNHFDTMHFEYRPEFFHL